MRPVPNVSEFRHASARKVYKNTNNQNKNINIMAKEVTKRSDNYSQWYDNLVVKADLAERSAVRGCMVIKPAGYAIWENIQKELDARFKATGHTIDTEDARYLIFLCGDLMTSLVGEIEKIGAYAKQPHITRIPGRF